MVFSITAKNIAQDVGFNQTLAARVTNANTGLYTVPAGKKSRVLSASMNLDAVGADATTALAIKRGATFIPIGAHVAVNGISTFLGDMLLIAGDIITNVGDAGATNSTCDMTATFQEYDA